MPARQVDLLHAAPCCLVSVSVKSAMTAVATIADTICQAAASCAWGTIRKVIIPATDSESGKQQQVRLAGRASNMPARVKLPVIMLALLFRPFAVMMTMHSGSTADSGHYTAICKSAILYSEG